MPSHLDTVQLNTAVNSAFEIEEVQLQFQLKATICVLLVRDNFVYLILRSGVLYKIDLDSPEDVVTIQITLSSDVEITNAWIDLHGYHLILRSSKNEYYYVNHQSNGYKTLNKLKSLNVNSICFFDRCVTKTYSGPLLLSTTNNLVLEYCIDHNKEMFVKHVIKNKYTIKHITSVQTSEKRSVLNYQIAMFTIDNTMLTFNVIIPTEPSSSVSVLQSLGKINPIITRTGNIIDYSTHNNRFGYVVETSENDNVLTLVDVSKNSKTENINVHYSIKSFTLTSYFILILTKSNKLEIYNQIDLSHVRSISLNSIDPKMMGFSYDSLSKTFWLYSAKHIYEVIINFEDSGILPSMIKNNLFDEALSLLSNNSSHKEKYDYILKKKAYYLLDKKQYKNASEVFVKTTESFDRVALQLLNLPDKHILRFYLLAKLNTLSNNFNAQKTLLSSWIVESYIEELNSLDNALINIKNTSSSIVDAGQKQNGKSSLDSNKLQQEFYKFLSQNISNFDRETIYQMIISHNRSDDLLYFANLIKDFHFVLKYYITSQKWDDALKVIVLQQDPELVYKSSTVLLVNHSIKTIDIWIRLVDNLDPLKLLPALLVYNKTVAFPQNIEPSYNQSLRLLKFLIYERNVQSKLIHNAFFSTLITYPNIKNENEILKHLENYENNRRHSYGKFNEADILFDRDFTLRLCFKFNKLQTAIHLYSMFDQNDEAVDLALKNDLIQVAILVADKPNNGDYSQRKQLWLKISKKLIDKVLINKEYISQNKNVFSKNVNIDDHDQIYVLLKYISEKCDLLTIKDLLPLFPDFVIVDNFKDSMVESLQKLSLEMTKKSVEMDSTLKEAEEVSKQIQTFEAKNFQIINPYESCELCHNILIIRKFVVFPCQHAFHQDCLVKRILDSNDYKAKNSIYKLQKELKMNSKNPKVLNKLKQEISNFLSKSCCLCSDMIINEIDEPFIKAGDKELHEWDIP